MNIHKEANATLFGRKILVVYDNVKKKPKLLATRGRDNAQYMEVEGKDKPAFAMINLKLRYIKQR